MSPTYTDILVSEANNRYSAALDYSIMHATSAARSKSLILIKNEKEAGKTYINKLLVAERQIAAAIQMYFLCMDPVAIHSVSGAAHTILADLLKHRGKDASVHGTVYGLFRAARDLNEGEITEDEVRQWGDGALELLQQFRDFLATRTDFDIEEISVEAPPDFQKSHWFEKRRASNFLKHADRDSDKLLDESEINNEDIILETISFSLHLNMKLTAEKHFFYCAMIALGKLKGSDNKPLDLEFMLEGLPKDQIMAIGRRKLCHARFQFDDALLEDADEAVKANLENLEGKDIQFFDLE